MLIYLFGSSCLWQRRRQVVDLGCSDASAHVIVGCGREPSIVPYHHVMELVDIAILRIVIVQAEARFAQPIAMEAIRQRDNRCPQGSCGTRPTKLGPPGGCCTIFITRIRAVDRVTREAVGIHRDVGYFAALRARRLGTPGGKLAVVIHYSRTSLVAWLGPDFAVASTTCT